MATSIPAGIEIYSNDGETLLESLAADADWKASVTSTGVTGTAGTYTYSGAGTFLGLATAQGSSTIKYAVGTSFYVTQGAPCRAYIVTSAATQTTFDLSTLNLSDGSYTITVKAKADNFIESNYSNEVNYIKSSGFSGIIKNSSASYISSFHIYVDGVLQGTIATGSSGVFSGTSIGIKPITSAPVKGNWNISETVNCEYAEQSPGLVITPPKKWLDNRYRI